MVRINPGLAGTAFLVSKIWDAVTDPFEGVLTDRTRTRFGRRRPYLLAGIPFIFLSFFLMWYPVSFASEAGRFAWVLAAYLFFSTVISLVMTPYSALAAELTLDYHERGSLMSWRILFSSVSSLVCAVAPLEIVRLFADVRTGWMAMAVVFGLFFALPFVAVFLLHAGAARVPAAAQLVQPARDLRRPRSGCGPSAPRSSCTCPPSRPWTR